MYCDHLMVYILIDQKEYYWKCPQTDWNNEIDYYYECINEYIFLLIIVLMFCEYLCRQK